MIRAMVIRDMRARYMGSFLGFFWSVIHPLTQLLLYYFVFAVVMKMRLGPEYGGASFAVWLTAGLLPWMLFAEAVTRAPGAVLDQSNLVKKMVFPSEIFPIVNLTAAIVNHLIAVAILLGFLVLSGYGLSFKIVLILPYLFLTGLLALGISWLLSAVNVFLRDIGQIISVVVNIWFFLTPIVYARQLIPERLQGLYDLNPMLHVVEGYRAALLGRGDVDMAGVAYLLVAGLIAFGLGGLVFKKLKPAFADVL
jgi:ABC-type polysaccharide/polyol phosphate export permease